MKLNRFSKFTWAVLGWNLLVILWGAFVRASGSGAGCGRHWPTCNGEVIPRPERIETIIEFTHRMMSGVALLLVLAMLIWGLRTLAKGHPARKGVVASSIFIITEALLGASLVLFEWVAQNQSAGRAIAVALHLANTFLLIGSLALTAYWASGGADIRLKGRKFLPWLLGLGLLGVLVIGMSGAITALGDTLFPAKSLAEGLQQDLQPGAHFLLHLRVYHPFIAVTVAVYTLYLIINLYRQQDRQSQRFMQLLIGVGVLQLSAGLTNLLLLAPIPLQIIHLLLADTVWITYVLTAASLLSINNSSYTVETS